MAPRRVCSCAALSEHVPGGRTCALGPRPSGTPGRRPPGRAEGERPAPVPGQAPPSGLEPAAPGAAPRPARGPLRERARAQARVGAAEGAPAQAARGGFLRSAALFLGGFQPKMQPLARGWRWGGLGVKRAPEVLRRDGVAHLWLSRRMEELGLQMEHTIQKPLGP